MPNIAAMPATFDAGIAVITLSAIGLMAVIAFALAAFVWTGRTEDRAARPRAQDPSRRQRAF